jgi:hypothetical protein
VTDLRIDETLSLRVQDVNVFDRDVLEDAGIRDG